MPRKKKEEVVEVKSATKKSTIKKVNSLDDLTLEMVDKQFGDQEQSEKVMQLIKDYSFESDTTERIRCVSIAFGNWRHGAKFDPEVGTKENYELHNFNKCKTILEKLVSCQ